MIHWTADVAGLLHACNDGCGGQEWCIGCGVKAAARELRGARPLGAQPRILESDSSVCSVHRSWRCSSLETLLPYCMSILQHSLSKVAELSVINHQAIIHVTLVFAILIPSLLLADPVFGDGVVAEAQAVDQV